PPDASGHCDPASTRSWRPTRGVNAIASTSRFGDCFSPRPASPREKFFHPSATIGPMSTDLLGIGITSTSLTDLERRILRENPPYAVVIFGRNIGEADEFRELTSEIKSLAPSAPPLLMID